MVSKAAFMARPKIAALPQAERDKRWKDHQASEKPQKTKPPVRKSKAPAGTGYNAAVACVSHYARALIDPYDSPPACLPLTGLESVKTKVFARGECTTGNSGAGFVYARPSPANDAASIYYTDNASGGAFVGVAFATAATAGVASTSLNSPFPIASFGASTVEYRMVAYGIRVMYTGKELDRGGSFYVLEEPNHSDLTGMNAAAVMSFDKARRWPIKRQWVTVNYVPVRPSDTEFTSNTFAYTPFLGILFTCPAADMTFDYEVFAHYEFIGADARNKTPTPVAHDLWATTRAVIASQPAQQTIHAAKQGDAVKSFGDDIGDWVKTGTEVWSVLSKVAGAAAAFM